MEDKTHGLGPVGKRGVVPLVFHEQGSGVGRRVRLIYETRDWGIRRDPTTTLPPSPKLPIGEEGLGDRTREDGRFDSQESQSYSRGPVPKSRGAGVPVGQRGLTILCGTGVWDKYDCQEDKESRRHVGETRGWGRVHDTREGTQHTNTDATKRNGTQTQTHTFST